MKDRRTGAGVSDQLRASESVRKSTIDDFMRQQSATAKTQRALLDTLISRNRDTAFGKEHGFAAIRGIEDYRRQVPIRHWSEISPYIDRVVKGEHDTLTRDPPVLYHWTSGTTGTPKMIPFTRGCDAATKQSLRVWLYAALRDNPRMLDGRVFALVNPGIDAYTDARVPYGSV